jgi:hypothetical protein
MLKTVHNGELFPNREFSGEVPSLETVEEALKNDLNYGFHNFFSPVQVDRILEAFYGAREDWSSGFKGQQFSLGEAWYHYVETGVESNPARYLDRAVPSREIIERHIPGLHAYIISFLSKLNPDKKVHIREHWAGPGIVTFLANNYVANQGGGIHFDTDGLLDEELADPSFKLRSFVATLQKPDSGGALRLWDYRYDHSIGESVLDDPANYNQVREGRIDYEVGSLYVFDGLKPHKIEPFSGDKDRVCLTFHGAYRADRFEIWF